MGGRVTKVVLAVGLFGVIGLSGCARIKETCDGELSQVSYLERDLQHFFNETDWDMKLLRRDVEAGQELIGDEFRRAFSTEGDFYLAR